MLGYVSDLYPDLYREIVSKKISLLDALKQVRKYGWSIDRLCIDEIRLFYGGFDDVGMVEIYINQGYGFAYPNYTLFVSEHDICDTIGVILIGEFFEEKEYMVFVNGRPYQWQFITLDGGFITEVLQ